MPSVDLTPQRGYPQIVSVPSSDPDKPPYDVTLFDDVEAQCSCPGFLNRHHCRHIAAARCILSGDVPPEVKAKSSRLKAKRMAALDAEPPAALDANLESELKALMADLETEPAPWRQQEC